MNSVKAFSAKSFGDDLVHRIPLDAEPETTAGGKTLVLASTYGSKESDYVVDGEKEIVGGTAYIPKEVGADRNPCGFSEVLFENRRDSRAKQRSTNPCRG